MLSQFDTTSSVTEHGQYPLSFMNVVSAVMLQCLKENKKREELKDPNKSLKKRT